MTTIVVDRDMGYMAADLMATANDGEVAMSCDTKIESINIGGDHYLVGAAGMEGPAEQGRGLGRSSNTVGRTGRRPRLHHLDTRTQRT